MALGKELVTYDISGNLQLQPEGLQVVKAIPNGFGIKVITAFGPGRIGKSSLLNQLSGRDSFGVGSTTERVTKGIWIDVILDYEKRIANSYIDVEGFGDPDKDDASTIDARLMFIVCQMCDVVIYNTKGVYDTDLVGKLKLVCPMFKRYRKHHEVFSTPMLIVCHRDFDLDIPENPEAELRDLLGQENAECFRSIMVFFFERPTKRAKLRNLRDEQLNPEYIRIRQQLEKYLEKETKPLCTYNGGRITAKVFVKAIHKTFNAVIEDNLEGISKNLVGLLREQNDLMIKEAVNKYTEKMKRKWPRYLKVDPVHRETQVSIKAELKERLYDIEEKMNSLLYLFEVKTKRVFQRISEEKANDQLLKLNSTIESNYANRSYFVIGGSDRFQADMDSLEERFRQCVNLGPKAVIVWENYKETLLNKRQTIQTQEHILHQEMESKRRREQARIDSERIIAERDRQAEKRKEMIRRQKYEQRRRNEEMEENALNIVAGVAEIGLRLLFNSLTR